MTNDIYSNGVFFLCAQAHTTPFLLNCYEKKYERYEQKLITAMATRGNRKHFIQLQSFDSSIFTLHGKDIVYTHIQYTIYLLYMVQGNRVHVSTHKILNIMRISCFTRIALVRNLCASSLPFLLHRIRKQKSHATECSVLAHV